MRHLRWGILGAGGIAGTFADALATTDQATPLAIGSRSLEKAQAFSKRHKVVRAYGSYAEVLADPEVDAVYIALPNHMHAEWSIRCADAGKHILCEKPVTVNAPELERVLSVVRQRDVFFMEAFMYRCHPQWQKVREIIDSGTIGEVRTLYSAFAFNMGAAYGNIRMQNPAAGGGLMDVGCYCVSFCRLIAREEPVVCHAVAHIGERSRVDEWSAAVLKFPSEVVAHITYAVGCGVPTAANIYGSKGSITVATPWFPSDENASIIVQAGDKTDKHDIKHGRNLYANEALAVAEHLDARQAPHMTWEDSLGQARTLDALRASMGLVFDCER